MSANDLVRIYKKETEINGEYVYEAVYQDADSEVSRFYEEFVDKDLEKVLDWAEEKNAEYGIIWQR
jgi:hypothetical protein